MSNVVTDHIEITAGVCGGRARIAGHRIRVQDVVLMHERSGRTPAEIVATHPQLTLADIHAALAYYFDHRDEIRRQIGEDETFAAGLRARTPSKVVPGREDAGGSFPPG